MSEKLTTIEYAMGLRSAGLSDILEFGVAGGDSLVRIKRCLDLKQGELSNNELIAHGEYQDDKVKVYDTVYRLFGFDSFWGLPENWLDADGKIVGAGKKGRFSTEGKFPHVAGVTFFQGWFSDTIPLWKQYYGPVCNGIALLHCDADLFSSTIEILYGLNDKIRPKTIIVFDEWCYLHSVKNLDHEARAFYQWVKKFDREFEFVDYEDLVEKDRMVENGWTDGEKKIVRILK